MISMPVTQSTKLPPKYVECTALLPFSSRARTKPSYTPSDNWSMALDVTSYPAPSPSHPPSTAMPSSVTARSPTISEPFPPTRVLYITRVTFGSIFVMKVSSLPL